MRGHGPEQPDIGREAHRDERHWNAVTERPLNLLVVSYHFPPDGAVGALRWGGITKYLARAGWHVDVITGGTATRSERVGGVHVHSVPRMRTLNDRYQRFAQRRSRSRVDGPPAESRSPASSPSSGKAWNRLRRTLAVSLAYPDYSRGWVLKAASAARRVIRRERIELVVSSGPPHAGHLVAMLATAGTRARWYMDMRDPWGEDRRPETPAIFKWSTSHLARIAYGHADGIICNTRQYAEHLRARRVGGPVHWIPNAIDLEDLPAPVEAPGGPLTLAYVGTLYLRRDFGPVIRAMEAFLAGRPPEERNAIRLRFAGHAEPKSAAQLARQLEASGLDRERVEALGRVSRDEARRILQQAQLSLVLAQQQRMQVPAKLYESMGLGVQTLVLAEPGSATALEAERIGALWRDPSDVAGITDVLEGLYSGRISARAQPIAAFDYETIAADVADLLMGRTS